MDLEIDFILVREVERKKVEGGFGDGVNALLESFISFTVFEWWSMSQFSTSVIDGNSGSFEVGFRIT